MKRKDILADFTSSLAKKDPTLPTAAAPPAPVALPPSPVTLPPASAKVAPASIKERASKVVPDPPAAPVGNVESGFQRITVSLTATDLKLADDKRFDIGQKQRVLLDRSKLLKVALRALDPDHPQLPRWIAEVVDSDLRKTKAK